MRTLIFTVIFTVIFAVTISLVVALPALLFAPGVMASEESEVKKLTQEKITIVIDVLRNKGLSKEEKKKRIVAAVDPIFDFKRMAWLSLGKKHRSAMNKAQKKEFSKLFVKRLKESYLEKLELYTDEEVVIEDAKRVKKRIHVLTRLVSKDDKKDMLYKFYKSKKKGWKVYDVVILGVSVVQTYRSQFSGLMKKGSIDDLLTTLRTTGAITIPTPKK